MSTRDKGRSFEEFCESCFLVTDVFFLIFRYGKNNILGIFRLVAKGERTQLFNLASYKNC